MLNYLSLGKSSRKDAAPTLGSWLFRSILGSFPIALAYIDPEHRYLPRVIGLTCGIRKHAIPGDMGRHGRIGR
jgi:hypothetical protein